MIRPILRPDITINSIVMKLQIHSIHFDADQKLLEYIQKKVDKLEKFYDRIVGGEVFLRLNNNNGIATKTVEIKIKIPTTYLFAKEKSNKFESATDEAVESIRRQLKKIKEKQFEH